MTIRLVAGLLVLGALARAAAAAPMVERVDIKGAHDIIIIPDNWNGSVFLYAHGYTADKRALVPFPQDLSTSTTILLPPVLMNPDGTLFFVPAGYASAATTFRSVGWYVKDAVKDIENLRRYFVKKYGQPKHTYIWGHSGGGMVTEAVIEYFPHTYEGAAPMCGTGAGARRNFDGAFDLRSVFEWVCRDVPAARFACRVCSDGKSRCVLDGDCPSGQTCGAAEKPGPPELGLTGACTKFLLDNPDRFNEGGTGGDFVSAPVAACFGGATPTAEQAARKDLFQRATRIPEGFIGVDMFFATIGMGEVVHRRTHGRPPWGNVGVDYASPLLTADEHAMLNGSSGVRRVASDPAAVNYMRRYYEPRAKTDSKVITVHALDDGLVIPENEDKYREAFKAAGREDQLVQVYTATGGHCGFIGSYLPALQALTAWVEQGQKPTPASVSGDCTNCALPGPWGLKVAERRQKGAPTHTLVCDDELGDCPPGSSCAPSAFRCE